MTRPGHGDPAGAAARLIGERVRRRVAREPVAYILGRKGFRHIELTVDRARADPAAGDRAARGGGARAARRARACTTWAPARARSRWRCSTSGRTCWSRASELVRGRRRRRARERGAARAAARGRAWRAGCRAGDYDLVVANLPYVREDEWDGLAAGDPPLRAARGARVRARTGSTRSASWSPARRRARAWRSSTRPTRRDAVRELLDDAAIRTPTSRTGSA